MQAEHKSGRQTLCQVIPTYNEIENIGMLIDRLQKVRNELPFELKIVVVDDNSTDGTAARVKELMSEYDNLELIQRPEPKGIGSAYIDGFTYAISKFNADFLGEIDADLQHSPEVLVDMCKALVAGSDVVIASRYVKGGSASEWSLSRKFVSKSANLLSKIFLRIPVADSTSGYRLMSRRAVQNLFALEVSSKGYSFQVESLYAYKKSGMSFAEVPYTFEARRAGKTKLNRKEMWLFFTTTIRTGILGLKKKSTS